MKEHTVQKNECVSSIAFDNGFFWETIWNHANNASLKELRKSPFILEAGDVVHIPDLRVKEISIEPGQRHVFQRKGVPETLNLQFRIDGEPRAGVPFRLLIDGRLNLGTLDDEGKLSEFLPPNAQTGSLVIETPEGEEKYELQLRQIDPIETISGVQARLKNLGFYTGEVDGALSETTLEALHTFQRSADLPETDQPDAATHDALVAAHKS